MQVDTRNQANRPDGVTGADDQGIRLADVRVAAMNLLARREHSQSELQSKLCRRFDAPDLVSSVLQELQRENLQSDERYGESLLRQRLRRGYGPARVRQDMRERGLDDAAIAAAHAAVEPDWFAAAEDVFSRKFGGAFDAPPASESFGRDDNALDPVARRQAQQAAFKEKARRMRFMQYRGFAPEHFRHLLDE
ncbi:regulatory protein RecX [Haliea sp. E1-2-M8]|uniref:regulatory protein RecX n=1 Tax=Haliea sp. E1-2-M8 TaxID=3064706 RepID=UPI00271EF4C3|nr:regulatory protein RecX [Haliea sp. E1-2-M8]MDO8861232.1 regulatory protein RecX [Haliea sp. E1-2-M8]